MNLSSFLLLSELFIAFSAFSNEHLGEEFNLISEQIAVHLKVTRSHLAELLIQFQERC